MFGSKSKNKANLALPSNFTQKDLKFDNDIKGVRTRKLVVIMAQQEQSGSWHAVKMITKPAVHGYIFDFGKRAFIVDMSKVWYYDIHNQPVLLYSLSHFLPVKQGMGQQPTSDTEVPNPSLADEIEVTPPIEPDEEIDLKGNIDSTFSYTLLYEKIIEQLSSASTPPEMKGQLDKMTLIMIIMALGAGIAAGLSLAPTLFHLVPASSVAASSASTSTTTTISNTISTTTIGGVTTVGIP